MRLAFVSSMGGDPWGGSEELWSRAAVRLVEKGHRVFASVHHWNQPAPQIAMLLQAGVALETRRETTWTISMRQGQRLIGRTTHEIETRRWAAWLRKVQADLLCLSNGSIGEDALGWISAAGELKLPYVIVAQANGEQFWPRDSTVDALAQAYLQAQTCFFVSQRNKALLEAQIGTQLQNAEVIRNPFNVRYDAAPEWPPGDKNGWRLACVGRLDPAAKGQDLLLRLMSLQKWRGRPLQLTFYGTGVGEKGVWRLCKLLDLSQVTFAGHVADVEAIWKENHALVLSSRLEGLPLAVVEAMLCSRAAIVTDVAGNTEMIEDGVTGFVAKAPTLGLLDEAMERAWSQREDWRRMGERAGKRVRELVPRDPVAVFCDQLLGIVPTTQFQQTYS